MTGQRKGCTGSLEFTERLASFLLLRSRVHLSSWSVYFRRLAFQLAGECCSLYFESPLESPFPFKDFSSTSFEIKTAGRPVVTWDYTKKTDLVRLKLLCATFACALLVDGKLEIQCLVMEQ